MVMPEFKIIIVEPLDANKLAHWIMTHKSSDEISESQNFWRNVVSFSDFGPKLRIYFNEKDITLEFDSDPFMNGYHILLALNDALYKLLTKKPLRISDLDPENPRLPMKLVGNDKIQFLPLQYGELGRIIENSPTFQLSQVVETTLSALKQVKDACWEAAQQLYPENPLLLMAAMFGKEEHYTKSLYEDESFDWLAAWEKSKRLKKGKFKKLIRWDSSKEHVPDECRTRDDVYDLDVHYQIQPLEEAWEAYKNEQNIS